MTQATLTDGPVIRALAKVSAPMTFGILAVLSVGVADAYYLGQLGEAPLAAVGFIFPVTTALSSLSIGLSAGANAAVSQSLGRDDDPQHTRRLGLHALVLGVTLAILLSVLTWLIYPMIFSALGAGEEAMPEISDYMPIWVVAFPFLVTMMIINAVFRAYGSGVSSAGIMILSAAINIGVTPVFIFGLGPVPEMGTGGAAAGTLTAFVLASGVALLYARSKGMLSICAEPWQDFMGSVRTIFSVGVPAAFSNAINPAGIALVTAAVATVGTSAVAGFGAGTRITSLTNVPMLALSSGIGPVVGQNWGAGKQERARTALGWCWGLSVVYGLGMGLILIFFASPIATLIADGGEAADFAATYLRLAGWSMFGFGIVVTTNAAMNARDKAVYAMILSVARTFALYLPLAWAGVTVMGYPGIAWALVAANIGGAALAIWCAARTDLLPEVISGRLKAVGV